MALAPPYPHILHPEYYDAPLMPVHPAELEARLSPATPTERLSQPAVSVIISSCQDEPRMLRRLFEDLNDQDYGGERQYIVTSARNSCETIEVAENAGAIVQDVLPGPSFRADMLNEGLRHAEADYIMLVTGHVALSNSAVITQAMRTMHEGAAAAYGSALPDEQAGFAERAGAKLLGVREQLMAGPLVMQSDQLGLLSADCAMVAKGALPEREEVFRREYGHGGGDGALGRELINQGQRVVRLPAMAFHHTHGFGPVMSARQLLAWRQMADTRPFDLHEMAWHPNLGL